MLVHGSELLDEPPGIQRVGTVISPSGTYLASIAALEGNLFRVQLLYRKSDPGFVGTSWSDYQSPSLFASEAEAMALARGIVQLHEACSHLAPIVAAELEAGNALARSAENAFEKCRLLFVFEHGYQRQHASLAAKNGLRKSVDRDPHYPEGVAYYCPVHQFAVLAPG
jgi:hypothetical protein